MKYGIEVTDEFAVEVDLPPNAPGLASVGLTFDATSDTLRKVLAGLGGIGAFHLDPTSTVVTRYALPLTRDGEKVGFAQIYVHLRDQEVVAPTFPAIVALKAEQDEALKPDPDLVRMGGDGK